LEELLVSRGRVLKGSGGSLEKMGVKEMCLQQDEKM